MKPVNPIKLQIPAVDLWMNQWLLLTAGTLEDCNTMTVAWGSIGCMWSRPFAQVVVRPQRHTRRYMDTMDSFTLTAFPKKYREDLRLLGTLSGRNGDKIGQTGLTLQASTKVTAPAFQEASLILECNTMYYQDMDPRGFTDTTINSKYPEQDYHRIYFGEILAAFVE